MAKYKKQTFTLGAFTALFVAEVLWGINKPVIKLGLQTIPLPVFLSVTILGTALLILPLALKDWKKLRAQDYLLLAVGSIISITIGNVALLMGLQRIPAINASLIGLFGPLLLFIFSVQFLKEKLSVRTLVGVLVAFAGAAIIIGKPWQAQESNSAMALGNLFLILAVTSDIIGTLVTKTVLKRGGTYQVTFLHLCIGIMPIAAVSMQQIGSLAPAQAGNNGYIAIVCNILLITFANVLFMFGLKRKNAQEIGVFTYVSPIATMAAAWLVLGETLATKTAIGAGLIFVGIYLTIIASGKISVVPRIRKRSL